MVSDWDYFTYKHQNHGTQPRAEVRVRGLVRARARAWAERQGATGGIEPVALRHAGLSAPRLETLSEGSFFGHQTVWSPSVCHKQLLEPETRISAAGPEKLLVPSGPAEVDSDQPTASFYLRENMQR